MTTDLFDILDDLEERPRGLHFESVAPNTRSDDNLLEDADGKGAPEDSDELERILAIPRRQVPEADKRAMVAIMRKRLGRVRADDDPCVCREDFDRECILELKPAQAWALYELGIVGGLVGPIGVGQGKTGLNILAPVVMKNCKTAVLMVPPGLVDQVRTEYLLWREHWKVPSLLVKKTGWIVHDAPALHVVPYSRLSRAEAATLLFDLDADFFILDEADKVRNRDAARTARLMRFFKAKPKTRLALWSGSLCDSSIRDYAHLSRYALEGSSPLPNVDSDVDAWAAAIDPPSPGNAAAPMGALVKLCNDGETLWRGYNRRLLDTRGVVATQDPGIQARLTMSERDPGKIPESVSDALRLVREEWERPDGEELVDAMTVARCCREIASGFFYRWIFPNGEPLPLVMDWLETRAAYAKEVRQELKSLREGMDSPFLLGAAAARWRRLQGECIECDMLGVECVHGVRGRLLKNQTVWRSMHYAAWTRIKGKVKPETEAIWLDDYLINDAAEWGEHNNGVIWYQHRAFGARLAEVSGFPLYAGGDEAAKAILTERGDRPIIASINSHGRGRNGLQFHFDKQLIANPPESRKTGGAAKWEQLLGRLHREGQKKAVDTETYRHTSELRDSWDRAQYLARFVNESVGSFQKLLYCDVTW